VIGQLWKEEVAMQRQCAWCLRLIDDFGERLSSLPVPKTYDASHGMCTVCGDIWLEGVLQDTEKQYVPLSSPLKAEVKSFTSFFHRGP
jgi:hypothetical protein